MRGILPRLREEFPWLVALALLAVTTVAPAQRESPRDAAHATDATVSGVTVYEPGHLIAFAIAHVQELGGELHTAAIADAVEQVYREDGYFLADASAWSEGGRLHVAVWEGWIETVDIVGGDADLAARVSAYLRPLLGRSPLLLADFERAVMLVDDLAGVDVSTEIEHPEGQAGAHLRTFLREHEGGVYLGVDNPPRAFGDAISARLGARAHSVLDAGDLLHLEFGYSYYSDDRARGDGWFGNVFYRRPVGDAGSYAEGYVSTSFAQRDLAGTFQDTDVEGFTGGLLFAHPLLRDVHAFRYLAAELRHSVADSETDRQVFDSEATALSVSYLLGRNDGDGAPTRFNLTLTGGVSDETGRLGGGVADDHYWHLRAGVGTSMPLPAIDQATALRAELWGQVTGSKLPTVDEFYLGSRESLRGYVFAEVTGDYGISGTLELAHHLRLPGDFLRSITPFAFLDVGYADHNGAGAANRIASLASAGVGATLELRDAFALHGHVGVPLKDGNFSESGSPALYLQFSKGW